MFGEFMSAVMAIAGGVIFIRGNESVYVPLAFMGVSALFAIAGAIDGHNKKEETDSK